MDDRRRATDGKGAEPVLQLRTDKQTNSFSLVHFIDVIDRSMNSERNCPKSAADRGLINVGTECASA
jgi:hypothetical protein